MTLFWNILRLFSLIFLWQHRTMGTAGFGGSFAPIVQYEKWEIHPVFPHFSYFRLCQNLSPNLLAPLCGAALFQLLIRIVNEKAPGRNLPGAYELHQSVT